LGKRILKRNQYHRSQKDSENPEIDSCMFHDWTSLQNFIS
jgi:hypothetical protein